LHCDAAGTLTVDAGALKRQVREAIAYCRHSKGNDRYILYFQAYSNTNAPVEALRQVYDECLAMARFVGLNVATRPDCLDEEKADLLASYREKGLDVWVELGLQSANDATLRRIGRGHSAADFERAYAMLRRRGLKIAVHLIFGLPGEGGEEILETIRVLGRLRPDGVKIHNLHIPMGTVMATEYRKGELVAPCSRRHLEYVIAALERLPPETLVMRLVCDTPLERLAAPRSFWAKEIFLSNLNQEMRARGARQGRLFDVLMSGG
jgi:hypothetical protein